MCGIVGFLNSDINPINSKQEQSLFENLLTVGVLRGKDSTGIFYVEKGESNTHKKAVSSLDFIDLGSTKKILYSIDKYNYIIGHNRLATMGKVTNNTAHPFQDGPITLVHNGTLKSFKNLPDGDKYTIDSEAITHSIATMGIEETAKLLNGAFALCWHDSRNNTINLLRNGERPLYFAMVKSSEKSTKLDIIIASEYKMIYWIAARNDYEVKEIKDVTEGKLIVFHKDNLEAYEIKPIEFYKPAANTLGFANVHSKANEHTSNVLKELGFSIGQKMKVSFEDFEPYQDKGRYGFLVDFFVKGKAVYEMRLNGFSIEESEKMMDKKLDVVVISAFKNKDNEYPVVVVKLDDKKEIKSLPKETKFKVFNGKEVTQKEWDSLTKTGCCWCSEIPKEKDSPDLTWLDNTTFLCVDCATNESVIIS